MLSWITPSGCAFPMPVEVEIDGRVQTVAMTGGQGELTAAPGAHVILDPRNRVLRRLPHVEQFVAWQAAEAQRRAAAKTSAN